MKPQTQPPPASDAPRVAPGRTPDQQPVYKKTSQAELKLHIYLPKDWSAKDKRPAIVFFFGGAWTSGTPQQFYSKAEYFASRGMVAASADYRVKSTHGVTPDKCVEDARSAMRWLRKNAADWGVDPDRLVASGGSAGGHLAACLALCDGPDDPADDLSVSPRPQAAVLFNPVVDLSSERVMARLSGADVDKAKLVRQISPVEHLSKGAPPLILFYGTQDQFVTQGRAFVEKSLSVGNRAELWTAEGQPHGFFNRSPWHETTLYRADEFLASLGCLTGPPTVESPGDKAPLKRELPAETPPK